MTTEQKLKYIEAFRKLLVKADNYHSAHAHANFIRGIIAAWIADMTIPLEKYREVFDDIETIMTVKRSLPRIEGVEF